MIKTTALLFLLTGTLLNAGIIPVFIDLDGIEAPNGVPNSLPVTLQRGVNRVFVPFDIPTANTISLLSSVKVTITVRDDDDTADSSTDEAGFFGFALGGFGTGPIPIGFFDNLDGSSQTFTGSITDPFELAFALAAMQDNNRFQIRVDRCCGDLIVEGVDVEVNAVPEPSTFVLMGGASIMSFLGMWRRKSKRA
jgi:hypothetical protein